PNPGPLPQGEGAHLSVSRADGNTGVATIASECSTERGCPQPQPQHPQSGNGLRLGTAALRANEDSSGQSLKGIGQSDGEEHAHDPELEISPGTLIDWIAHRLDCGKTNAEIICRIHSA